MTKTRKVTPQQQRRQELEQKLRESRPLILARDNYVCFLCGARSGLADHHILGRQAYPSRILESRNRVTLCTRDHNPIIHTKAGRRKLLALMQAKYGYNYTDLDYSQYLEEVQPP